jgi:hypothetical protein
MREVLAGGAAGGRAAVLFCALILAAGSSAAGSVAGAAVPAHWPGVTVVCRDGTRLDGVDLAWSRDGFLLRAARPRGDEVTLAPADVLRVFGPDGSDLTDAVGAACPATGITYTLLGRGSRVPFTFSFMGDLGGGLALDTADGGGDPVGVLLGGLRMGVAPPLHVRVGVRRLPLAELGAVTGTRVETWGTDLLLLVGARLQNPRENDNYAYVEGGLALIHVGARVPGPGAVGRDLERDFTAPVVQGGVVLPLSPSLGVDLGVTIEYRPSLVEGRDEYLLAGANVALTWRSGGQEP